MPNDDYMCYFCKLKSQLEIKLSQRKALHDQRVALRNLEHIVNSLNKVERLLGLNDNNETMEELSGDLLERVASDVNYLNFCVSKCDAKAFVEEIKPRLNLIGMYCICMYNFRNFCEKLPE